MSAREELFESLTGGGWSLAPGEADSVNSLLDAYRSEVLHEAAALSGRSVGLFEDSEECAAAAGALEGLAIRLRRMADETAGGKDTREGESTSPADFFEPGRAYVDREDTP
ncbi:hypothetical protein [Streptomyces sp. NPDC001889]